MAVKNFKQDHRQRLAAHHVAALPKHMAAKNFEQDCRQRLAAHYVAALPQHMAVSLWLTVKRVRKIARLRLRSSI